MSLKYDKTVELVLVQCCACFIEYGIPAEMNEKLLEQRARVNTYCPNGHQWHYRGKSLEEQLQAANARAVHAEDQRRAAERQAAAFKGQVTRMRNRVGNGVCPCCNRTFQNLGRHMQAKHPDFKDAD